jgi:hypothetical protein
VTNASLWVSCHSQSPSFVIRGLVLSNEYIGLWTCDLKQVSNGTAQGTACASLLSTLEPRSVDRLLPTLLVLDIGSELVQTNLLSNTFSPLSVLCSAVILENGIDLLERKTLELGEDEPSIQESSNAEAHEDDVSLVSDVVEHDRGDLGNGEV